MDGPTGNDILTQDQFFNVEGSVDWNLIGDATITSVRITLTKKGGMQQTSVVAETFNKSGTYATFKDTRIKSFDSGLHEIKIEALAGEDVKKTITEEVSIDANDFPEEGE